MKLPQVMVRSHSILFFGVALRAGLPCQVNFLSPSVEQFSLFQCLQAAENVFHSNGFADAAASVRLVGPGGAASNVGLLQVRMQGSPKNEFGSVCGMSLV